MLAAYNTRLELIVFKFGTHVSQFWLPIDKVASICPDLPTFDAQSDVPMKEITGEIFNQLQEAHQEEYYKSVNGFYVPRDADLTLVRKLIEALHAELPVMIEYETGYEEYSASHTSSNGLVHTCYLGCSNGPLKTLLRITQPSGSTAQAFSFAGLRSVYVLC